MSGEKGLREIKPHSHSKYRILSKYLGACKYFSQKYQNFAYVETHGGTGRVYDIEREKEDNGSVLRAAKTKPSFKCYVSEIDDGRYRLLKNSTRGLSNVELFHGDCNKKIDLILGRLPKRGKFVFFFLDPDGLTYNGRDQLNWRTVEKISNFPRSEILLNFPIRAISGLAGMYQNYPESFEFMRMANYVTRFYGTDEWKEFEPGDRESLLRLYISKRLDEYRYKGAILIRNIPKRGPLYYLIYGSKHDKGGKIMRDIMKKEWLENIVQHVPITRNFYDSDREWLDKEYHLNLFIFED